MDFSVSFDPLKMLEYFLAENEFPETGGSKPSDDTIRPICERVKSIFMQENNVLDIFTNETGPIHVLEHPLLLRTPLILEDGGLH